MTIVFTHISRNVDAYMKQWQLIKYRKEGWKEFRKLNVPNTLKDPTIGKIAICTIGDENLYNRDINSDNASMVIEHFKHNDGRSHINLLQDEVIVSIISADFEDWLFSSVTQKLNGYSFAITGPTMFPRAVYQKLIELNGGTYKANVSKKTTYLVNSTPGESTKVKRAKQQGVQLINEIELFKMLA